MRRIIIILLFSLLLPFSASAAAADADGDRVPDFDEINIYRTNPNSADTDGDGISDWEELNKGYSPHNAAKVKLEKNDHDADGLSDRMELNFHTNPTNADTDGDGHKDGEEIANGFDPLDGNGKKLQKRIEINTKKQELGYFLGGVRMGSFKVSTGKASTPTPKGNFEIENKEIKAWSRPYALWMPYWLGMARGKFGMHELPYWPNGYREGANHLGTPVSHGCIRLGIGSAKIVYDWTEIGTPVAIY